MNGGAERANQNVFPARWAAILLPLALFLVALALRLAYLREIAGTPLTEVLLVDSETYDRFARLILGGAFRGEETYSMNILYPWFLALVYSLTGGGPAAALLAQAFLGALNCVLIARIGSHFFGRAVGFAGGFAAAIYGPFIFYSGAILTPTIVNFFCLLALAFLAAHEGRRRTGSVFAAGIAVGLAALGRGNSALLVPAALPFFLFLPLPPRRKLVRFSIFAAAALSVPLLVTARNYFVEKRFVPLAANYAAFYIGHNRDANGLYTMPGFVESARFEGEVLGTKEWVSRELGRPVTVAESARVLFRWGVDYIREEPGAALSRTLRKLYFFWNRVEAPTNLNYHFALDFSRLLRLLPAGFGIVAPLSLLGLGLSFREWRKYLLLYGYVAVYLFTCVLFFVSAEYRLPAVPVLMLFALFALFRGGGGARRAWRGRGGRAGGRELLRIGAVLLVAAPLFVFCNYRTPLLKAQTWKRVDYLNFGVLYREKEEFDKAAALFRRSIEIDPRFGPAYDALSELYRRIGDDLAAARCADLAGRYALGGQYETERTERTDGEEELLRLGRLYQAGEYEEALAGFETLLARTERGGERDRAISIRNNVGLCCYKLGRLERAEREFRLVIEENPSYLKGYTNLALVRVAAGDRVEAESLYRRALEIDPNNPRIGADLERLLQTPARR